jgi:hypothetical protein
LGSSNNPPFQDALTGALDDICTYLLSEAVLEVIHDRDMVADQYFTNTIRIGSNERIPFPRECVMLLPRGADYALWKGAVVFDIVPIALGGHLFISIGMHRVLPHPTRNAYVATRTFLIDGKDQVHATDVVGTVRRTLSRNLKTIIGPDQVFSPHICWVSPFDPAYLYLIDYYFSQWQERASRGQLCWMRSFCFSKHMTPEAMARDLKPYLSDINLRLLRDRGRHIINLVPMNRGEAVQEHRSDGMVSAGSPSPDGSLLYGKSEPVGGKGFEEPRTRPLRLRVLHDHLLEFLRSLLVRER